jgi:hypothetical protein
MFISDFIPITVEEIPPTEFFFSKKRKAVVKNKMHMREGAMVKNHRVLLDGKNLEEEYFSTESVRIFGIFCNDKPIFC